MSSSMDTFHIPRPDADTLTSNEVEQRSLFLLLSFDNNEDSNSSGNIVSLGTHNKLSSTIQPKPNQHPTHTPAISTRAQG